MKVNYFEELNLIDKILQSKAAFIEEQDKEIILLINKSDSLRRYFFDNLKDQKWFPYLRELGYFNPENNPKPIEVKNGYSIPQWEVLGYIERLSLKIRKLDIELLEIIKNVSLYKEKNGKHIDNYRTWWFFVKILQNIPLSRVPKDIFTDVIPIWLISIFDLTLPGSDLVNKLLPIYLKQVEKETDVKKIEKLVKAVLSVREPETKKSVLGITIEVQTKIDNYWLEESFIDKENATLIAQKCSNSPIINLANTIKDIFNKKQYKHQDYSSVWLRDLTHEQKKSLHDSEWLLAAILRKLVLEKSKYHVQDGGEIIEKFISDAYPYYLFKRLAILLIGENWVSYKKYFDQLLDNKKENYFDVDAFYPELSYLLTKNADKLTKAQRSKIATIIEKGPVQDLPEDRKDIYKNYWKQRWYKVLISIPEFKRLHDEILDVTKREIVEREEGESDQIEFDKSPVSAEEFLSKTNEDIVKYVKDYKPSGEFSSASPEGIYQTFQSAVKLNPTKFTQNLKPFKTQDYHMLLSLYNGLEETWKEGKDIHWKNVIDFTSELLKEKWFWKPTSNDKNQRYDYFGWTISAIGDLIQEGCQTDERSFPEDLNADVENVITILIDNLSDEAPDDDSYRGDGVTYALNSSWGKVITALIYLGLREARLSDKKDEKKGSKWNKSLKSDFEKAIKKNIYEANTLLGQYLPNLHYIDKEWVETHARKMHLVKEDKFFEAFMDGYLFSGRVYENLYKLLKDSYLRALGMKFKEVRIQERLIQHIAVGYLRGNEELGANNLIDKIINSSNSDYIREAIEFLWHQRDFVLDQSKNQDKKIEKERYEFKKRIFVFWDYIINFYKRKKELTEEDKKVLSELCKLAVYLSEIDKESYDRLLFPAPYATYDFDSPFFIEYLNQLKEKGNKTRSAEYIAKLFIVMLKGAKDLIPDFDWNHIEEIVHHLYSIDHQEIKDLANQICIFYAEKGNLGLRVLYEKNNAVFKE